MLYNRRLETVHTNNQTILHFVNNCSEEAIENITSQSTVNKIDGYMDASITVTKIRYNISIYKDISGKITKQREFNGVVFLGH